MAASPYETVVGFVIGPWPVQAARAAVDLSPSRTTQALGMSFLDCPAAHPEEGALFGAAMASMSAPVIREAVDVIGAGDATTVVDVGGAHGSFALAMLARHPGLEAIVLDLPHAVPGARAAAAERGLDHRLTAVAGDFFTEVPPGDILLLKYILHDWSDDECVTILSNCRAALRPGGRIVITEIVIDDHAAGIAPLMDIAMLATAGSRERTRGEFDDLLSRAGLRRTAATPLQPPYFVIEAAAA